MAKKKKTKKKWGKIGPPKSAKRKRWLASIRNKNQKLPRKIKPPSPPRGRPLQTIRVNTAEYESIAKHKPTGRGTWRFRFEGSERAYSPPKSAKRKRWLASIRFTHEGLYTTARREARRMAEKEGAKSITLLPY